MLCGFLFCGENDIQAPSFTLDQVFVKVSDSKSNNGCMVLGRLRSRAPVAVACAETVLHQWRNIPKSTSTLRAPPTATAAPSNRRQHHPSGTPHAQHHDNELTTRHLPRLTTARRTAQVSRSCTTSPRVSTSWRRAKRVRFPVHSPQTQKTPPANHPQNSPSSSSASTMPERPPSTNKSRPSSIQTNPPRASRPSPPWARTSAR